MKNPSYRVLRIVLLILSVDAVVKGLLMIFGGKPLMMRLFPYPAESELSTLLLLMRQEWGATDLAFSFMLFFASRDPVRHLVVVDAVILALSIASVSSLLSIYTLDALRVYPAYSVWGHSLMRLAGAGVLFYLRPRGIAYRRGHQSKGVS